MTITITVLDKLIEHALGQEVRMEDSVQKLDVALLAREEMLKTLTEIDSPSMLAQLREEETVLSVFENCNWEETAMMTVETRHTMESLIPHLLTNPNLPPKQVNEFLTLVRRISDLTNDALNILGQLGHVDQQMRARIKLP